MAKKKKKFSQEELDFIRGRTNKLKLSIKKKALGFSPAQETASGAGSHGKGKKSQAKSERKKVKKEIRNQEW